ncbi:hypothetical protein ACFOYU_11675 [Microvirga sp. GCM10011540]|uniref:hypothetical protein n=1 Tax=Microvirga sp. GCM10011540 TaxID=3317338 RepID=UPI00361AAF8B
MTRDLDRLIARILVARPASSAFDIRRLVPEARGMSESALAQKIDYLRPRARQRALARPQ